MSGMLRQPSQSSTSSFVDRRDLGVDDRDRLRWAFRRRRPASSVATNSRRPSWTCGAGEPDAVVLLHRLDHVVDESLNSRALDLSAIDGAGLGPKHGMAHARDFQNRHDPGIILGGQLQPRAETTVDAHDIHPHDESHAYRYCPRCGTALEKRVAEAERAGSARLPALRIRVLHRPEDCRRHDHPIRQPGASCSCDAPSSRDTASGCFPAATSTAANRSTSAALREAREECGLDVRLDGLVNVYSYAGRAPVIVVYAATAIGGTTLRGR